MPNLPETVLPIMKKTRDMLLPYWGKIESIRQKDESPHNVVTKFDEEIERFLSAELAKVFPGIPFVGEEFGGDREAKRFWLADPIDGTAHFIRGLPFCSCMLALIEDGQVVFSVIYDFVNDAMYHAEKGRGAFKNGERIHVSDRPVTHSYIGSETHLEKPENVEIFLRLRNSSVMFKTVSAGYEAVLVAEGKLEGRVCFEPHGKDYDYAPGSLLISEAGGIVANLGKETYDYRNTDFIAANIHLYKHLTEGPDAIFPIKPNK
jgi:fructose-1,6-bisphosphatase/inositol monophosphatase family enzyme